MITSRHDYVGLYIGGGSSLHELHPLNQDDSWSLFSKMAMSTIHSTNETRYSTELVNLGRKISEKCGGVPLAIVVTAGLLVSREKTEFQWRAVLESIGQEEDGCSKILALSYKDLPTKLKPCFLYFGIFPEDREISAFQLINMWVAEGFVQARGVQLLEDVGEDYLNKLIARNLVQVVRRRHDGRIKSCRIHDRLHNLCILEAVKGNFFNTRDNVIHNFGTRVRRVSIHCSSIKEYVSLKYQTPKLRALLCFNGDKFLERNVLKRFVGDFRFLRVLTVESIGISLPDEIGSLSYLSYFEINGWGTALVELPSTMGNLKNLLTLNFQNCHYHSFPTFIWKMKQLRHVLVGGLVPSLVQGSCEIRSHKTEVSLPNIQTLYDVPSDCLEPGWLHKFSNLRKLGIFQSTEQAIEVLSEATPVSEKLEELRLHANMRYINKSFVSMRLNLSRYQNLRHLRLKGSIWKLPKPDKLPPNLTKLFLCGCLLEEDPLEALKNLPNLKILKLDRKSYEGRKMICSGGVDTFPQLEVLKISRLGDLQELSVEGGMPILKELQIFECSGLKEMSEWLKGRRVELIHHELYSKLRLPPPAFHQTRVTRAARDRIAKFLGYQTPGQLLWAAQSHCPNTLFRDSSSEDQMDGFLMAFHQQF